MRALLGVFARLSPEHSSALGGALGRALGPRLRMSRRARENLRHAFPETDDSAREAVVVGMWDNLGRVMAEYPHLGRLTERIEIVGGEHIDAVRGGGAGGIFISGHIGNWELLPFVIARRGAPLEQVYRAANNVRVDRVLSRLRAGSGGNRHRKGRIAARALITALRQRKHIGLLVDQKLNAGIALPFFGRDAMTSTAAATLALRFGVPIVRVRLERLGGTNLRFTALAPLLPVDTGDHDADVERVTRELNGTLEGWIRERPEQWLWIHRRWPRGDSPIARASVPPRARDRDASGTS